MKYIKLILVVFVSFFAMSAMANDYYYQQQTNGYYQQPQQQYNQYNRQPNNYIQNNQSYRQYRQQQGVIINSQEYNNQPREYYENNHNDEFMKCNRRWSRSGMRSRYDRNIGCMVEVGNGAWVPESAIRYSR